MSRRRNLAGRRAHRVAPKARLVAVLFERCLECADERPFAITRRLKRGRPRLCLGPELRQGLSQEAREALLHFLCQLAQAKQLALGVGALTLGALGQCRPLP